ncbi:DNA polymerase [Agrobacterium phage OLIVR1]|uniref:DNA polymerase I n=1 Tax=Agrobacterium phage OLIVR1 TaxID=2723769 RepID=A0A858MR65_9CAUD|nr:DNA polymerase [Agrobacterium phage OLIVR1]QIW87267.1 DNA polymerase I [Agrobacterium phage OLIVR1]
MKYYTYDPNQSEYPVCILVNKIKKDDIKRIYLDPYGLDANDVIIIDLHQIPGKKKTPAKDMKDYITNELLPVFEDLKVQYLIVGDAEYYKVLTKSAKADLMVGYVVDCAYGPYHTVYVPNYQAMFHDPDKVKAKVTNSITALMNHAKGSYEEPGSDIIKYAAYPETIGEIQEWLEKLLAMKCPLTVDIEGWSLKPYHSGIATITFCWNQHEGIAFPVDLSDDPALVRRMLRDFFERMEYATIYHNIAFDVMVLIYQLYMKHITDTKGLLRGLRVMLKNWHDTKLITYLVTNSCAGNKLGLKDQAQEFAGNYAVESINDITKIPLPQLLQYNLVDGLSTWFVYNKHWDTLVADQQLKIYNEIFKPAIVDIIQMQLTGLPIDMKRVKEVKAILQKDNDDALDEMNKTALIQEFNYLRVEEYVNKMNNKWVKKRTTVDTVLQTIDTNTKLKDEIYFNPNSAPQLQALLFEELALPVLNKTKSDLPATDAKTLKALKNHTKDPKVLEFLDALLKYKGVAILLTTFIPAFEAARQGPDGWHYLIGNFNLGGTVSGRLSSSDPNMQNLPATGSKYAKVMKSCFAAPPGWLFCGIDFNSLEDRISALTTRDPNKLKVYTDGYDGHCLRAYAYFGDQMPDIDPTSVESINSIADKYKGLRQDGKVPTFSLTYAGTYITIMKSQGWSEEKSKKIEASYHNLYQVSDEYVAKKLDQACNDGYITAAFGLRVRTPLLKQVIRGTSRTPHEAEAEGRTAGNALGQSWCLLNSRAGSEFMGKVRKSRYCLSIRPCAQIHDAQYFLVRDDIKAIKYANDNVVLACEWQDDPEIYHPDVKLGGEFGIFYPDWSQECGLPNKATHDQIREQVMKHWNKLHEKKAA